MANDNIQTAKETLEQDIFALVGHYSRQYGKVVSAITLVHEHDKETMRPEKLKEVKITQIENSDKEPNT